jgi:branched-subunit amino acid transport protein
MRLWLIVAACGVGTYGIRLSMLMFVRPSSLPPLARDALRFVTPAVLAAIIAPAVLYVGKDQHLSLGIGNNRLIAALVAAGVAVAAKNVWLTIGCGMAALWTLQSF